MRRIFVTGAEGMLGRTLVPVFRADWEVKEADLPDLDVTDSHRIGEAIAAFRPDVVIHLAAMTDVDACETDPETAQRVNSEGTANVASACRACDATMVYLSTGMIYNGRKRGPYIEYDAPDPINVYGRTKYEGELAIQSLLEKHFIFNTCWMFAGGQRDRKFVAHIIERARSSAPLTVVEDTFGSPTYTLDLARAIHEFLDRGAPEAEFGRYHCVGRGCVSRLELARAILDIAGIRDRPIEPISSSSLNLPAPRPRMEAMGNYCLDLLGLHLMRDWREALAEYIATALR